jgi:hypothetical protein
MSPARKTTLSVRLVGRDVQLECGCVWLHARTAGARCDCGAVPEVSATPVSKGGGGVPGGTGGHRPPGGNCDVVHIQTRGDEFSGTAPKSDS